MAGGVGTGGGLEEAQCQHLQVVVSAVEGAAERWLHAAKAELGRSTELDENRCMHRSCGSEHRCGKRRQAVGRRRRGKRRQKRRTPGEMLAPTRRR